MTTATLEIETAIYPFAGLDTQPNDARPTFGGRRLPSCVVIERFGVIGAKCEDCRDRGATVTSPSGNGEEVS